MNFRYRRNRTVTVIGNKVAFYARLVLFMKTKIKTTGTEATNLNTLISIT